MTALFNLLLIVFNDHPASAENSFGETLNFETLVCRIVDTHVVGARIVDTDGFLALGVEDDNIRIGSDGDGSFFGEKTEGFGRGGGSDLDKTVEVHPSFDHSTVVDQTHPVFHTRCPVGDLGEGFQTKFLLFLEAEMAMVGGDRFQVAEFQSLPEFILVPFFTEGRSHHPFCAFKSLFFIITLVEEKILGTGFRDHIDSAHSGPFDLFQCIGTGKVDDV